MVHQVATGGRKNKRTTIEIAIPKKKSGDPSVIFTKKSFNALKRVPYIYIYIHMYICIYIKLLHPHMFFCCCDFFVGTTRYSHSPTPFPKTEIHEVHQVLGLCCSWLTMWHRKCQLQVWWVFSGFWRLLVHGLEQKFRGWLVGWLC